MVLNCFHLIFHGDKALYKIDHGAKIMAKILSLLIKSFPLGKKNGPKVCLESSVAFFEKSV